MGTLSLLWVMVLMLVAAGAEARRGKRRETAEMPVTVADDVPPEDRPVLVRGTDGRVVAIALDGLVSSQVSAGTRSYLSGFGDWVNTLVLGGGGGADRHVPGNSSGVRFRQFLDPSWVTPSPLGEALSVAATRMEQIGDTTDPATAWELARRPVEGERARYVIDRAEAIHIRRGDVTYVHRPCGSFVAPSVEEEAPPWVEPSTLAPDDPLEPEWMGISILRGSNSTGDYGEIFLYQEAAIPAYPSYDDAHGAPATGQTDGSPGERRVWDLIGGFRMKPDRTILLSCELAMRRNPPSVGSGMGYLSMHSLVVKREAAQAANNRTLEEQAAAKERGDDLATEQGGEQGGAGGGEMDWAQRMSGQDFPASLAAANGTLEAWGLEWAPLRTSSPEEVLRRAAHVLRHRTRVFTSSLGRAAHIFDGLFPDPAPLRRLREYVHANASYNFDDSVQDDSDNVQFIVGLDEKEYGRTVLAPVIQAAVDAVTPWAAFAPYDVSVNIIRSWDHTMSHTDCAGTELEYTALLYLNEDMGLHDGAETVFFDDVGADGRRAPPGSPGMYSRGPPDAEVIGVIRPVFGRLAVFNGNIPHSARPPASGYREVRFTFAVKHKSSITLAKSKTLLQALHSVEEGADSAGRDRAAHLANILALKRKVEALERKVRRFDVPNLESLPNGLRPGIMPDPITDAAPVHHPVRFSAPVADSSGGDAAQAASEDRAAIFVAGAGRFGEAAVNGTTRADASMVRMGPGAPGANAQETAPDPEGEAKVLTFLERAKKRLENMVKGLEVSVQEAALSSIHVHPDVVSLLLSRGKESEDQSSDGSGAKKSSGEEEDSRELRFIPPVRTPEMVAKDAEADRLAALRGPQDDHETEEEPDEDDEDEEEEE